MINEGLTQEEIQTKIKYLEKGINLALILSGKSACVNRIVRVKLLKSYLKG